MDGMSNVWQVAAGAVLAMCAACGPAWATESSYAGDPTENAIAAFVRAHGALSDSCKARAESLEVDYTSLDGVHSACQNDGAYGCVDQYDSKGQHATVYEHASPAVLEHETMHVLLWCQLGAPSGDSTHSDHVWDTMGDAGR